jgi:phenylacetate-coenzyme A ligase PaaK-like adenylate-forming protein
MTAMKKQNTTSSASDPIRKEDVFESSFISRIIKLNKSKIDTIMLSSGSSGNFFSMGLQTKKELKKAAIETDNLLKHLYGAELGETFIINASAMGVKALSNSPICDTGPRTDIVIELLKSVAPCYEKTFVIGDPLFIKLLAEESIKAGVEWSKLRCWFVSGGDWIPETLRTYVHLLTNRTLSEPDKGFWFGIYGLTELGTPICFETEELIRIRSKKIAGKEILSENNKYPRFTTPFLFHYFPSKYDIEAIESECSVKELVFTTLEKNRIIKLKRYATGDAGEPLANYDKHELKCTLPLIRFWGRLNNYLHANGKTVFVNDVKELIFENSEIAGKLTGFFSLYYSNREICLDIQLKFGFDPFDHNLILLKQLIDQTYQGNINVSFKPFYEMQKFLTLDFERKFNPLNH